MVAQDNSFIRGEVRLSTLVLIANTNAALGGEAVRPEAGELDVGLGHSLVCEQEPCTKYAFGKDIKDCVSNDLGVDTQLVSCMGDGPDNRVSSPENKGVSRDGGVEPGNVGTLCSCEFAADSSKLPDDHEIGNTGECVPEKCVSKGSSRLFVCIRTIPMSGGECDQKQQTDRLGS